MKRPCALALLPGLMLLMLADLHSLLAAPAKAPSQKWEYCFVINDFYPGKGQILTAYLPRNQKIFQPLGANGYQAIAQLLNRLGDQGWEVINYREINQGRTSWMLKRPKS